MKNFVQYKSILDAFNVFFFNCVTLKYVGNREMSEQNVDKYRKVSRSPNKSTPRDFITRSHPYGGEVVVHLPTQPTTHWYFGICFYINPVIRIQIGDVRNTFIE